jgi:ubiquinone/menaquinone biosynthesis C-methylase UbiE
MVEIGCGLGRMTHRFAEHFGRVYSVDVSPEMLKRAGSQWASLANVEFILGHGNDFPGIADRSIDFVFSFIVLQHVPEPTIVKDYLRETARVLKPDGLAYLQFRTDVPTPYRQPSIAFRAFRAATHPRRALRTALTRLRVLVFPRTTEPPLNWKLADEFGRFESWRGCALPAEEVGPFALSLGLRTEDVTGVGTQYTFYTFRRS